MLSQANRLKKKKDFDEVFKKGRGVKEDFLFVKYCPNNKDCHRFGFVVSKAFSKKAVLRNKIKRRLRDLIREKISLKTKEKTSGRGYDVVLVVLPGLINRDFKELKAIINTIFSSNRNIL